MATKTVGDSFPYKLLDQAFKKHEASDKFRIFLTMKIAERAEIEMQYIKQLQNWVNDLNIQTDRMCHPTDQYLKSELMSKILGSMRSEAAEVVESRQRVYNLLMSEHGPYSKLQILNEGDEEQNMKMLEKDFHKRYDKRNHIAMAYRNCTEAREHSKNRIGTLETQLAERSRITSSKRPTSRTGPRKIDEMRDKLSRLRRQNDMETEKIALFEEELLDEESSAKQFLKSTEKQLQELETQRMRLIMEEIKRYFECLQNNSMQRSPRVTIKGQQIRSLEEAEKLVKVHWLDVHTNAKKDDIPNYQDMFSTPSARSKKNENVDNSNEQSRNNREYRPGSQQGLTLTESVSTYFYYKSSSGSSVEADGNGDSVVAEVNRMQHRMAGPALLPSQRRSEESIETLNLPPEVRCPADITVLEPNKQYTTRMKVEKLRQNNECRQAAHLTEYSTVDKFVPEDSESDEEIQECVGKLRNVRVIAVEEHSPSPSSLEIAFKKGQIIKQKFGANEDGLCYGWTRENLVGKKHYGYYHQDKVRLLKKNGI
ncbi:uncharacterized protein LOC132717035 [Ruditapes philippinarum]|uniref:uncharacterized protein LOC132717035 n=1 Tax=Ruditapes philippinarum TaxID=129788 RepID=UPI00295B01E4|nr:uncharacterized protein LOC132717035 [Ruditapes philippinarum]